MSRMVTIDVVKATPSRSAPTSGHCLGAFGQRAAALGENDRRVAGDLPPVRAPLHGEGGGVEEMARLRGLRNAQNWSAATGRRRG